MKVKRQSDGTYTFQNVKTGKYAGVQNNTNVSGFKIKQYSSSTATGVKWIVQKAGTGYTFTPQCTSSSNRVIAAPPMNYANGTDLFPADYTGHSSQL